jgi:hypothetical protein
MRFIYIVFFLFVTSLFSNEDYELKLYENVLNSIFNSQKINIYVDEKSNKILKNSDKFVIVDDCDKAILKIGKDLKYKCKGLPWFATNYKVFKNEETVFGAFYWRKGRPQLKFNKKVLENFKLVLPQNLKKYEQ